MSAAARTSGSVLERPLAGRRIVLTRPYEQAGDFEERVRAMGGEPEIAPAIGIAPPDDTSALDAALADVARFEWILFTSANAVRAFAGRMRARGVKPQSLEALRLAAVGPVTAAVLSSELRPPDAIAGTANASSLGEEVPVGPGSAVLVPHGDLADETLAGALRARGAVPHQVLVYRTVPGEGVARIAAGVRGGRIDALLFASGSAVRFVAGAVDLTQLRAAHGAHPRPAIFCIGPSTARVAAEIGWRVDGIASETTQPALIDVMTRWFAEHHGSA